MALPEIPQIRKSTDFERTLHKSVKRFFVLKDAQRSGRHHIPAVNTVFYFIFDFISTSTHMRYQSVRKSIEKEHEMFSSYVKAHRRYPDIVISFLDAGTELIHSCHFAIQVGVLTSVTFVMLVTYTEHGERLSCSQFADPLFFHDLSLRMKLRSLVAQHCQVGF